MNKIIVAGSDTNVGKTIVSAILVTLLNGDYWKPVQCGEERDLDTNVMRNLIDTDAHHLFSSSYTLKAPLSPHHAARLENTTIELNKITLPNTERTLIIEGAGGIFAPLTIDILSIDLFKTWNCQWVIVSRHYLGSINHTLLTIEALKNRRQSILGLVFNGEPNPDSEAVIMNISNLPMIGRLLPENTLNRDTIKRYAKTWNPLKLL